MAKNNLEDELDDELMADKSEDIKKKSEEPSSELDLADTLADQLEDEEMVKDWKYLKLSLEQENTNNYYLHVNHQSHGFMNYLVSKVLKCNGVSFAAYKNTSLSPANIYIRTDGTRDIKLILKEAVKLMRTEWKGMGNAVAAMKI
ncbi:RpoL/Rpb11 RNA polymerase subunit family protein [Candidatus Lokiarchaeum ossiferum]|uniref:RpoL/Rpb11 RNA polymerase subunit family protein n=1 Tax=Candidatus Lokiarchaeum ossiferum TaxID=2951803 RepID=UPI00352C98E5